MGEFWEFVIVIVAWQELIAVSQKYIEQVGFNFQVIYCLVFW